MNVIDLINAPPEPLDPALKAVHTKDGVIHHPLYVSVFHHETLNGMVNRSFRLKLEHFNKCVENGDWSVIDTLIEKPYRMEYMLKYIDRIPDDQWWPLLADVWISCENHWQCKKIIPILFKGRKTTVHQMLDEKDREMYDALPDKVVAYRGVHRVSARNGWSWTTSLDTACWFSRRWKKDGMVYRATVDKSRVLFCTNGRKEHEVVIDPTTFKSCPSELMVRTKA